MRTKTQSPRLLALGQSKEDTRNTTAKDGEKMIEDE